MPRLAGCLLIVAARRGAARSAAPPARHRRHRRVSRAARRRSPTSSRTSGSRTAARSRSAATSGGPAPIRTTGCPGSAPRLGRALSRSPRPSYGLRYAYNVSPEGLDTVLVFAGAARDARGERCRCAASPRRRRRRRRAARAAPSTRRRSSTVDLRAQAALDRRRACGSTAFEIRAAEARLARSRSRRRHPSRAGRDDRPGLRPGARRLPAGTTAEGRRELAGGTAEIDAESWERVRVSTDSTGAGLLVLGRAWLPALPRHRRRRRGRDAPGELRPARDRAPAGPPPGRDLGRSAAVLAALGAAVLGVLGLLGLWAGECGVSARRRPTCHPGSAVKESVG